MFYHTSLFLAAGIVCQVSLIAMSVSAGDPAPITPIWTNRAEERIYPELGRPTHMDFEETPLEEVVDFLRELHGIEIQLDVNALDEIGIGRDTPVTIRVQDISLRSALRLMFQRIDPLVTYVIQHEVILITINEAVDETDALVRVYNVRTLLDSGKSAEKLAESLSVAFATPLADASQHELREAADGKTRDPGAALTEPNSTKQISELPSKHVRHIAWFQDQLIVRATNVGHQRIQLVLGAIAAGLEGRPRTAEAEREIRNYKEWSQEKLTLAVKRLRDTKEALEDSIDDHDPFGEAPDPFGEADHHDLFGEDDDDPFG